jgi:thiamine transport system ATP-binding protein
VAEFLGYDTVLEGAPARLVRDLIEPGASWTEVALRRSALVLDPEGPLEGEVLSARATPELIRLELDVVGLGRVSGVAGPGQVVGVGERVRTSVRGDRAAALGGRIDRGRIDSGS